MQHIRKILWFYIFLGSQKNIASYLREWFYFIFLIFVHLERDEGGECRGITLAVLNPEDFGCQEELRLVNQQFPSVWSQGFFITSKELKAPLNSCSQLFDIYIFIYRE